MPSRIPAVVISAALLAVVPRRTSATNAGLFAYGADGRRYAPGEGRCAFTQPCSSALTPGCHPINATTPETMRPRPLVNTTRPIRCPQYADNACCNDFQNTDLDQNFQAIETGFGPAVGLGCEACVQNLYELWCAFTCSPRQAEFVEVLGLANMIDPNSGINVTVLQSNLKVDPNFACATFASCKGTFVAQQGHLAICEQFMDFQAKQSAIGKGSYTNTIYVKPSEDNSTLSMPFYDCCNFPKNFSDFSQGNTSCPCATCAGACGTEPCYSTGTIKPPAGGQAIDEPSIAVMNGFEVAPVIGLYAALAFISVLMVLHQAGICNRKSKRSVYSALPGSA